MKIIITSFLISFLSLPAFASGDSFGGADCNKSRNRSVDRHQQTASQSSAESNEEKVKEFLGTQ